MCPYVPGFTTLRSAQRSERRTNFLTEELRLFPGGEVAARVRLVEIGEGRVALLDPTARRPEDLVGERGEADRERHLRRGLASRKRLGPSALPVRPAPPRLPCPSASTA